MHQQTKQLNKQMRMNEKHVGVRSFCSPSEFWGGQDGASRDGVSREIAPRPGLLRSESQGPGARGHVTGDPVSGGPRLDAPHISLEVSL